MGRVQPSPHIPPRRGPLASGHSTPCSLRSTRILGWAIGYTNCRAEFYRFIVKSLRPLFVGGAIQIAFDWLIDWLIDSDICLDEGNDYFMLYWILQVNVRVSVNNWHAKKPFSFLPHCCRISTSNPQKDTTVLKWMKCGEQQWHLLLLKLEWFQEMHNNMVASLKLSTFVVNLLL